MRGKPEFTKQFTALPNSSRAENEQSSSWRWANDGLCWSTYSDNKIA